MTTLKITHERPQKKSLNCPTSASMNAVRNDIQSLPKKRLCDALLDFSIYAHCGIKVTHIHRVLQFRRAKWISTLS